MHRNDTLHLHARQVRVDEAAILLALAQEVRQTLLGEAAVLLDLGHAQPERVHVRQAAFLAQVLLFARHAARHHPPIEDLLTTVELVLGGLDGLHEPERRLRGCLALAPELLLLGLLRWPAAQLGRQPLDRVELELARFVALILAAKFGLVEAVDACAAIGPRLDLLLGGAGRRALASRWIGGRSTARANPVTLGHGSQRRRQALRVERLRARVAEEEFVAFDPRLEATYLTRLASVLLLVLLVVPVILDVGLAATRRACRAPGAPATPSSASNASSASSTSKLLSDVLERPEALPRWRHIFHLTATFVMLERPARRRGARPQCCVDRRDIERGVIAGCLHLDVRMRPHHPAIEHFINVVDLAARRHMATNWPFDLPWQPSWWLLLRLRGGCGGRMRRAEPVPERGGDGGGGGGGGGGAREGSGGSGGGIVGRTVGGGAAARAEPVALGNAVHLRRQALTMERLRARVAQ